MSRTPWTALRYVVNATQGKTDHAGGESKTRQTVNAIRITVALLILGAGLVLFFLHLVLWHDPLAAIVSLSATLLCAELVRPSDDAVVAHHERLERDRHS